MKHIFLLTIVFMSAILPPILVVRDQQLSYGLARSADQQTVESTFNFTYSKSFNNNTDQKLDPSSVQVNETVDQITSFAASGIDVFLGNDSLPDFSNELLHKIRVTLTQATIFSDKDSFDNLNEIYFVTEVNHKKIETGLYTNVAVNDTIYPNYVIFEDWCLDSKSVVIEVDVWETDTLHIERESIGA